MYPDSLSLCLTFFSQILRYCDILAGIPSGIESGVLTFPLAFYMWAYLWGFFVVEVWQGTL